MGNYFDKPSNETTGSYLTRVGVGLAILFATVYVVGKAWKKSQKM